MKKLLLVLLVVPLISFCQDNIYSVNSEGGLNVRDKPGSNGKKIATLLLDDFFKQIRFKFVLIFHMRQMTRICNKNFIPIREEF